MAVTETIQELLQGIDDAQYGRDMRDYIHKAIQKCYEEGSAGETDLVAREAIGEVQADIDTIDGHISNIVDSNGIVELQYDTSITFGDSGKPKLFIIPSIKVAFLQGYLYPPSVPDRDWKDSSRYIYMYNLPSPMIMRGSSQSSASTMFPIMTSDGIVTGRLYEGQNPDDSSEDVGILSVDALATGSYNGIMLCYPYSKLASSYPIPSQS